jgi:hypothetical protein
VGCACVFSLLVDADFRDTEAFMDGEKLCSAGAHTGNPRGAAALAKPHDCLLHGRQNSPNGARHDEPSIVLPREHTTPVAGRRPYQNTGTIFMDTVSYLVVEKRVCRA